MFFAFVYGLFTYKPQPNSTATHNQREAHYMRIIGFAGTLYLLSLPLVITFTNFALDKFS